MQISAAEDLYLVGLFPHFCLESPLPTVPWEYCTPPDSPEDLLRRFALNPFWRVVSRLTQPGPAGDLNLKHKSDTVSASTRRRQIYFVLNDSKLIILYRVPVKVSLAVSMAQMFGCMANSRNRYSPNVLVLSPPPLPPPRHHELPHSAPLQLNSSPSPHRTAIHRLIHLDQTPCPGIHPSLMAVRSRPLRLHKRQSRHQNRRLLNKPPQLQKIRSLTIAQRKGRSWKFECNRTPKGMISSQLCLTRTFPISADRFSPQFMSQQPGQTHHFPTPRP